MIGEWMHPVPFRLVGPMGSLPLNDKTGGSSNRDYVFLLDENACFGSLPVRVTTDPIPQGDGNVTHRRWRGGYVVKLGVKIWETNGEEAIQPACGAVLREALDELGLHLNSFLNPPSGGRLYWQPTGYGDERMLYDAQLLSVSPVTFTEDAPMVEFELDSPYPYYVDATEIDTSISDGSTVVVNNAGNTEFLPVIHVFGSATTFTITNHDAVDDDGNALLMLYDGNRPGAAAIDPGDYLFLDFFRNVAYLNGNENNRKAGIDVEESDFFELVPGPNSIEVQGADILVKSNGAWA